jgi:hypothetical protein
VVCWINTDQTWHGLAIRGTAGGRILFAGHKWWRMIKVVLARRN